VNALPEYFRFRVELADLFLMLRILQVQVQGRILQVQG
jgi:hypothetical protein